MKTMSHQIQSINREKKKNVKDQIKIPDWKSTRTEVLTRSKEHIWVGKGIIKPANRSMEVIKSEEWKEKWMRKNEQRIHWVHWWIQPNTYERNSSNSPKSPPKTEAERILPNSFYKDHLHPNTKPDKNIPIKENYRSISHMNTDSKSIR